MKNKNLKNTELKLEKITISTLEQVSINGGREINANTYFPKSCYCTQSQYGDC